MEEALAETNVIVAVGRRKEAVVRVRMKSGSGRKMVNGRPLLDYFRRPVLVTLAEKPIFITNMMDKVDFTANCSGGGLSGQAGALSMSLARALQKMDPGLRALLGTEGLLTRDARMKERKKYGQPGARKRSHVSKG